MNQQECNEAYELLMQELDIMEDNKAYAKEVAMYGVPEEDDFSDIYGPYASELSAESGRYHA
jgi:hypothetical protein